MSVLYELGRSLCCDNLAVILIRRALAFVARMVRINTVLNTIAKKLYTLWQLIELNLAQIVELSMAQIIELNVAQIIEPNMPQIF